MLASLCLANNVTLFHTVTFFPFHATPETTPILTQEDLNVADNSKIPLAETRYKMAVNLHCKETKKERTVNSCKSS